MLQADENKQRKRLIVEEVTTSENPKEQTDNLPLEEVKEKVEELQTITEHMGSDIKESENIQEDLAKAIDEVQPKQAQTEKIEEPIEPSKPANPLWIIIPGIFLLGALLGGIIFYQKSLNETANNTPSPTPSNSLTTPEPTVSPTAEVDFSKYSILVQNGSGIPGEASSVSNILTSAGFNVSKTGNADSYDYTKTVIQAKASVPTSLITKLSETLSKSYVVDKPQTLAEDSTNEIVVIVGSSKK